MIGKKLSIPKYIKNITSNTQLLFVGVAWITFLFFIPLLLLFIGSLRFESNEGIFSAYRAAFSGVYIQTIFRSFYYGALITVITVPLSYALSYFIIFKTESDRILLAIVVIPFWVAYIIRYIGIQIILSPSSPIIQITNTDFGILFSTKGVIIGLVSIFLPFAILPIYNSINSIDKNLIGASRTLGANQLRTIYNIILPLSLSGVAAGGIIVFILGAGSFLAPAILGGPGNTMIANLIQTAYSVNFNIELASALAIIYTSILLVLVFILNSFIGLDEVLGEI